MRLPVARTPAPRLNAAPRVPAARPAARHLCDARRRPRASALGAPRVCASGRNEAPADPAQPRSYTSRSRGGGAPRPGPLSDEQLAAALASAVSLDRVLFLLQSRTAALTPPVASAALQALSRYSGQRGRASDALAASVVAAVGVSAAALAPREAALCAHALARMGTPPPAWLPALLQAAAPEALRPRELALLAWAVATLRARPSAAWLAALWAAVTEQLPAFTPQDCGMVTFGVGALRSAPAALKPALERATLTALPELTPCALTHLVYAFTAWPGEPPSELWCRSFWAIATARIAAGAFTPRELANLLRSSAMLGAPLQPATLTALEEATGARMASLAPQDLANIVWALCRVQRVPSEQWLDAFVAETRRQLGRFKARELSVTLWALADIRHRPSDAWLAAFAAASQPQLAVATPPTLANLMWAFAVLDAPPPEAWLAAYARRLLALVPQFSSHSLSLCCWGLVALQAYRCAALPAAWAQLLANLQASDGAALSGDDVYDVAGLLTLETRQMDLRAVYEVFVLASAEAPGLLQAPAPAVLDKARSTWLTETAAQASANAARPTRTYAEVAACLRDQLALAPAEMLVCPDSGRLVDLSLVRGAQRLALQVDGPARCLRNTWQPSGATRLRDRALAAAGWQVLPLPFYTLDDLRLPGVRADYLRKRLSDAGFAVDAQPVSVTTAV